MNKRRIWATSPVYYVMAAVMFIMACFSYTQNKILFAVEITVSGLCLAAVIMTDLHYRVHVYTALRAARKVLSADEQRNLGQFALPLAVLGSAGDIVWTNERFQDLFTENGEGCGDNIAAYIYLCVRFYPKTEPPFPTATASLRPMACAPKAAVCFTLWTTRIISRFSATTAKSARSLRLSRSITARS